MNIEITRIGSLVFLVGIILLPSLSKSAEVNANDQNATVVRVDPKEPITTVESAERLSWLPFTSNGYVGISGGKVTYNLNCVPGFSCDDTGTGFKLFTGGKLWNVIGLELSYLEFGKVDNAGGSTRARGIDLSLLGNLPLGEHFSLFGKVGSTYAQTRTSASAPGAASGKERGFGLSYGGGLNYDFTSNWGVRAEWERHRLDFVGSNKDVDFISVGVNYRF